MSFLEECRKAEDEDGVGRVKAKGKIKVAAATTTTSSPSYSDAFAKQLKKQQQQFDALMGNVQAMVTTLQSHNVQATSSFCQGNPSFGMRGRGGCPFTIMVGGESLEVEAFLHMVDGGQPQPQRPNCQQNITHPQQQGNVKTYTDNQCWQCGEIGHLKRSCPMLKGKGLLQGGNA